jgi:hypothetical protein
MDAESVRSHNSYSGIPGDKYGYCQIVLYCTQKLVSKNSKHSMCGNKAYKYLIGSDEVYCNFHDPEKVKKTKTKVVTAASRRFIIESDSDDSD